MHSRNLELIAALVVFLIFIAGTVMSSSAGAYALELLPFQTTGPEMDPVDKSAEASLPSDMPAAQTSSETEEVAGPEGSVPGKVLIQLVKVADGLVDPVSVTSAPGDPTRLFVIERAGRVRIVQNGQLLPQPFLDITAKVLSVSPEQGLYDMAFHPNFTQNGLFYVRFADLARNGDALIVQYQVSADNPNQADPNKPTVILQIKQPLADHPKAKLAFGPDGNLPIGNQEDPAFYDLLNTGLQLTGSGKDEAGNLYVTSSNEGAGTLWKLVPAEQ